jgi:uncharacterized Tic20 family protein
VSGEDTMSDTEERDLEEPQPRSVRAGWDFTLMVATIALLALLGAQSLLGALYTWWAQRGTPDWTNSAGYASYVSVMNAIAAPLIVAVVVVIGLCVPKRMFERRVLLAVSAAMVALGGVYGLVERSLTKGMAAYLVAATALQIAAVVLTLRRSGPIAYLTEGRRRLGSALLHLGFILTCLVVVALQDSALMLPVFYGAALLLVGGSVMSFYARG